MNYKKHKKGYRMAAWLLFGLYLILMVYFLFFAESMGRNSVGREYHYNLQPFKEIHRYLTYYETIGPFTVFLNLGGNILAELIQLVTRVGSCDVDDMILNTLGGMIGHLCFKILFLWHKMELKGAANEEKSTG